MHSIDLNYLQEIAGGDKEVIIEMLQLLIDESPKHVEDMQQHLSESAWDALGASAHSLKPMLLYVGLTDLNETVKIIEERSKKKDQLESLHGLISELAREYDEVVKALVATKEDLG